MRILCAFTVLCAAVLSGCLRVNTDPSCEFQMVQDEILCKTGYEIARDPPLNCCKPADAIAELLHQDLTLEHAVIIALMNNRRLQAVYEKLGIAKANFAQAGLLPNPIFSLAYRFSTEAEFPALIDIDLMENFLEALLIPLKKRMAACELEIAKQMISNEVLDVIAETKMAFYALQAKTQIFQLKQQLLLAADAAYDAT